MVLVSFSSQIVADLAPIAELPAETFFEFVNTAVGNVLGQKTTAKQYAKTAAALGLETAQVQKSIVAVAAVLTECAKKNASAADFALSSGDLGLSAANADALGAAFASNARILREYLGACAVQLPQFVDLRWRLDVEVASRAVRGNVQPAFLLELVTSAATHHSDAALGATAAGIANADSATNVAAGNVDNGAAAADSVQRRYLQSDYANLAHVASELSKAVAQGKGAHARRVARFVK